ncbi:MAG: hypothetical protein Q7T70_11660 [Polaromonas sp.]|nr:hypothetical protein [Polaromonas sp.]
MTPTAVFRPSLTLLGTEPWRAAVEYVSLKVTRSARSPKPGDGHPVIIFPGLGTDGMAVRPLRRHCQSLGYAAQDWGRGYNTGRGSKPGMDPALSRRLRTPPPVPTTSIYSRSDGIVAWQTCCHPQASGTVQDIEVRSSHIGMGWNPAVLRIITDRLGQPRENWQPYGVTQ